MKKIILPLLLLVLMFDLSAMDGEVEEAMNTLSLAPYKESNSDTKEELESHVSAINDFLEGGFNSKLTLKTHSKEGKIVLSGAVFKNETIMSEVSSRFSQRYCQFFSQTFAEIIRLNPFHFNLEEGKLTLSGRDEDFFDIGPLYSEDEDFLIGIRMLMKVHGGERASLADVGGFSFQSFLQLLDPNSLGTLIEDPAAFSPEDDGEYADIGSIVVAVDECPITALLVKVKKGLIYTSD
ncbi:MAG: hypothetical protein C0582_01015 [Alphaproteobacteria bacterium]|nr:MAG: hypothetical protein C0582_01015 [Alphaproteobacteria bacterium]